MDWIVFFIALGIVIFAHELGHTLMAIKCGVPVEELAIGFGFKLWQKKFKKMKITIRAIPLGGYTKFKNNKDFDNLPYKKKALILLSGVASNILVLLICYFVHYQSIKVGIILNWIFLKARFTGDIITCIIIMSLYVKSGILFLIELLSLISVINLIPIPPMDGSHLLTVWIQKLTPNYKKIIRIINAIGMGILLALMIAVNYYLLTNMR